MDHIDIPELVGGNGSSLYRYCCRGALWSTLQETGKCMENGRYVRKSRCMICQYQILSLLYHLQFMFHLLKDFPCQWSMKSSVNSIQFITELNPPRKCRANVHCTDLELKWSAAIANIHCTTHLFPLTISTTDTLSTLSTPQSRGTLSQPLRSISPPSGHCKSSQIISQDQSHTRTLLRCKL